MLLVARTVAQAALSPRRESRGARINARISPDTKPAWELTQVAALRDERIILFRGRTAARARGSAMSEIATFKDLARGAIWKQDVGETHDCSVRARPVGCSMGYAGSASNPRSFARDSAFSLYQRQRLQRMHDGTRWRDRLTPAPAALAAAGDGARATLQQEAC